MVCGNDEGYILRQSEAYGVDRGTFTLQGEWLKDTMAPGIFDRIAYPLVSRIMM